MNIIKHGNLKKHKSLLSKLKKEYTKSRRFCGFIRLGSSEVDRNDWEKPLVDIIEENDISSDKQKYFSPLSNQNLEHSISTVSNEILARESEAKSFQIDCERNNVKIANPTSFGENGGKTQEADNLCDLTIITDFNHDINMSRLSDMSYDYYELKKRITNLYTEMDVMFNETKIEFRNLYRKLHKSLYRSSIPNHLDGFLRGLAIRNADVDRYFQLCREMDKISKRIFENYKLMVKMSKMTLDYEKIQNKVISKYVKDKALSAFRKRTTAVNNCSLR